MPRKGLTVCADPGCPELVPASGCWCFEHLEVCEDMPPDCRHPAHACEESVHFCDAHGGPERSPAPE